MHPDLAAMLPSWQLALRAEHKSPSTIKSYSNAVNGFIDWAESSGVPAMLNKSTVNGFVASLLERGREPSTARARQLGLRRFSAWLEEEGEIPSDALLGIKSPKLDSKVIEPLTDAQLKQLLKACTGNDLRARRDEAIIRFMVETAARAGECATLALSDVDLMAGTAVIRRGKGAKGRIVPFGSQTARALDRYRRTRAQHPLAHLDLFWLGDRGKGFGYDALHKALAGRAAAAGVPNFHPHLLRHTGAHRWLAAGGSEGGLMTVAGWTRPDMIQRYTKARAAERAATEARTLNLGDI